MVEPEWDDRTRDIAEALALHDADLCDRCGIHPYILEHPELFHLTVADRYCPVCALVDKYGRQFDERDADFVREHTTKKSKDGPPPSLPRPNDGKTIAVRSLTEAEASTRHKIERRTHG